MAYNASSKNQQVSPSNPSLARKLIEDPSTHKNSQCTVTCVYQTHIGGFWHNVTILWSKNLMNYSLSITVDSIESDHHCTCNIDLKRWHFWAKKGYKSFEVDGNQIEAFWDLRSAKFSSSPEPCSDFYVALVHDEEVVLLLGDYKKKAYKRTKSRPALLDGVLFYKKEHVFGKKSFSTRVRFDSRKKEHDILVESTTSGDLDPELWISIDGVALIHIKNLQWKFRGNQTVLFDKQPLQILWDVHGWLFCGTGSNYGLFIFKPGGLEGDTHNENKSSNLCDDSESNDNNTSPFCLFLYAWKIE